VPNSRFARIVAVALAAALSAAAGFANAEDLQAGRKLAERYCAKCHNIEKGGAPKLIPPTFASIAGYRAPNYIRSAIAAPDLHKGMPGMAWALPTADDIDNLTAYIVSLEAK